MIKNLLHKQSIYYTIKKKNNEVKKIANKIIMI